MIMCCMSEDVQVKEVPCSIVTRRILRGAKAERASAEECLMIHEPVAYSPAPLLHSALNTRHGVATGKQEATYNMSCVEESL